MFLNKIIQQWIRTFRRSALLDSNGRAIIRSRSIYILPTKQGLVLALVLILMLIGSINYGSNLGYLVTFLLGGVWLTTILHTWRNLLGLTISPLQAAPVFAAQSAAFKLLLENPTELSRFGISITTKGGSEAACDLPKRATMELNITLPAPERGHLRLKNVSIHSRYPLGLFHAWTYADPDMTCLVYPQPAGQGEPPSNLAYNRSDSGERGVGADDFVGLRGFRYGDSPRHIDWKALARERGLYSKIFGGDRSEQISLDWDLLEDADPEVRLSQLCRFILLADERRLAYDLKLPGIQIPASLDESHKHHCLASLALFRIAA